jgi:hypothetical protein
VPPAPSGEGSRDAAVVVAIEDYAHVEDVAGAKASGEAWLRWLLQVRGVPADRVHPAFDADATDIRIRAAAKEAAAQVESGGTLWFVYVGHGAPMVGDALLVGSVRRSELLAALDAGAHAHAVVLLDACFSGQTTTGTPLVEGMQPLVPIDAAPASVVTPRTHVLAAARAGQYAGPLPAASGPARPAFSYLALGGLLGWADLDVGGNRDGRVSARELQRYVAGALRQTVRGRSQDPELSGADLDLAPVVRRDAPALDAIGESLRAADSGRSGTTRASSGSEPALDLVALAAEAATRAEERARAEQAAAEAQRRASAAYRAELDSVMGAFRARVARDFAAVTPLLKRVDVDYEEDRTPPEVSRVLDAFMERYRAPSVTVGGETIVLDVPEYDTVGSAREEFWGGCGDGYPVDTGLLGYPMYEFWDRSLYVGQREVAQRFWQRIMGENPSRYAACGPECPVDSVSFCDALAFANRLSTLEGLPEAYDLSRGCAQARLVRPVGGYRLPTREEWLADARADAEARAAAVDAHSSRGAQRPAEASAGAVGPGPRPWDGLGAPGRIADLVGSVGEWVWPARDGRADAMGGSWADAAPRRVEDRTLTLPVDARSEYVGLRLVRQAPQATPATPVAPAR